MITSTSINLISVLIISLIMFVLGESSLKEETDDFKNPKIYIRIILSIANAVLIVIWLNLIGHAVAWILSGGLSENVSNWALPHWEH